MRARWPVLGGVLALAASGAVAVYFAAAPARQLSCAAPPALAGIGQRLDRVAMQIRQRRALTIVALGSSSTRGVGASSPQQTYPSRLQADLQALLPAVAVHVVNRGRNGEEVPQMLARMERDVLTEHPDLVIWQLGTNAVLHGADPGSEAPLIARGITRLKQHDIDIVLMDLQYAPRVLARPDYAAMEQVIADAARRAHVGLFHRFAIMQAWRTAHGSSPQQTISSDGLHMNDRGYGCVAADLAEALAASARPPLHPTQGRDAGTIAGLAIDKLPPIPTADP
jgi:acyl-CoA thioesterase I